MCLWQNVPQIHPKLYVYFLVKKLQFASFQPPKIYPDWTPHYLAFFPLLCPSFFIPPPESFSSINIPNKNFLLKLCSIIPKNTYLLIETGTLVFIYFTMNIIPVLKKITI